MLYNKKKLLSFVRSFAAVILVVSSALGCASSAHSETTAYNWFFCKNDDHSRPPLGAGLEFTEKHDLYYLGKDEKVIYLTFDFGYENGNVAKILDALLAHHAPGAFFILENSVKRSPDLITRMITEGHTVCNHTLRHPDMAAISDEKLFCAQLTDLEKCYREATGFEISKYYRPPQGRFSEQNLRYAEKLGYKTIMWSFAYADWDNNKQPDPERSYENIIAHTHPGMVILLHPTSATNAAIMDRLLTEWENEGYRFGTMDELCGR